MVWIEEINKYLVLTLRERMRITSGGVFKPVSVDYRHPEGEGRPNVDDDLPKIVVHLDDLLLDLGRVGMNLGVKQKVAETINMVTLADYPDPYWLFYDITMTTEFSEDTMSLLTQIQSTFPPRSWILVRDSDSNELVSLYMELVEYNVPQKSVRERTQSEDRRTRRFTTRLRYKITAELSKAHVEEFFKVRIAELQVGEDGVITVDSRNE